MIDYEILASFMKRIKSLEGVGLKDVKLDNGHLIFTLTNDEKLDIGNINNYFIDDHNVSEHKSYSSQKIEKLFHLDTTKSNANDCIPNEESCVKFYRVGNNATNIPIQQAGIIETFVYRDNGNVRVTQRYTVNYNTNGNPTYTRTGIGTDENITWNPWTTYEKYSTSEIAIGQWVDGKTLYRKVIEGTASFSNDQWTSITISSDNVSKSIKRWNICIPQSSLRMEGFNVTNNVKLSTVANQGYGSIVTNQKYTLILEYTK